MPVFTTACPRNCYSTCTLRVQVEDGRLRRIEAHPANRATPEGPCLKGLSYVERVRAEDRILRPLRRTASGEFAPISWDEALDVIAERLEDVRTRDGPQAVLYYAASGTKGLLNRVGPAFWRLYGGYTTTYGDLCWPAGLEATRLTLGDNRHNAPWDLANARLIVLWGKNPAETNIHQMVFVEQALRDGARLVVVDPRRTQSAEQAHLLVQPRPGTDGALALALGRLLIERGAVDEAFVAEHVLGFDAYRAAVARWTPARAAEVCDVEPAVIEAFADLLASVRPVTINAGFGMQRYTNSGQAVRAIIALLAITGNVGRPGAGWVFANLQSHVFDDVKDPLALYPPEHPDPRVRISIPTARLGPAMRAAADPPLRFAWVERGNPLSQNPDTNAVRQAFRGLDFRVVVDQFLTDTAREADIVLPAKTMFEQSDVVTAYWHPYLQLKRKVLEPPGEVRPESEVYWALADRLGIPRERREGLCPPGDAAVDAYLRRHLERCAPDVTLEMLEEGPVPAPGSVDVAFADRRFPTPSGRIELRSDEASRRWGVDPLPSYQDPVEGPHAPAVAEGPRTPAPPLHFLTPNTRARIHSQFNNLRSIRALSPGPEVVLHPEDARERGLEPGARARVFNARGSLRLPVAVDLGLRRGCAVVTNGWWATDGGAVNLLSAPRETDMGHGAAFHDNAVWVEPAE